jgi:hypothetical protein
MKRFILKLLGIPDFQKEIKELKRTIETLKDEATNTYKIYEDAFCFIKGLDIQDKDVPWYEDKSFLFGKFSDSVTMDLAYRIRSSQQIDFAVKNPSLKIRKIYHGCCHGCQTPLERGIGACTGCRYLVRGENLPDLSTTKDDLS